MSFVTKYLLTVALLHGQAISSISGLCFVVERDYRSTWSHPGINFQKFQLYWKIFKSNETVIISLLKSCCVPVSLYALEALDLNSTAIRRLDNALFLAFCKTFKTFDKNTIMNCMYFTSTLPLRFQVLNRNVNLLSKLEASENKLLAKLLSIFGLKELEAVCTSLHMGSCSDMYSVKIKTWEVFRNSLIWYGFLKCMHSIFYIGIAWL